jgi:hypothetical protein
MMMYRKHNRNRASTEDKNKSNDVREEKRRMLYRMRMIKQDEWKRKEQCRNTNAKPVV